MPDLSIQREDNRPLTNMATMRLRSEKLRAVDVRRQKIQTLQAA